MATSLYRTTLRQDVRNGLPEISSQLDSIRTYQFEVKFEGVPLAGSQTKKDLTLAAKQVDAVSYGVEPITVHRVNDVVYYPGKPQFEPVTITFDNLMLKRTSRALWEWFKTIYDPMTGDLTKFSPPGGSGNTTFKAAKMTVMELDNTRTPRAAMEFYGVYPQSVSFSEKNYSQGEFSTIAVSFRYDYLDYFNYGI